MMMMIRTLLLLQAILVVEAMPSFQIPPGLQAQFAPGLSEISSLQQNLPCTLFEQIVEYGGNAEPGSEWVCEVFGIDARNAGSSAAFATVWIEGMEHVLAAKSDIASGKTTLLAKGAVFQGRKLRIGSNNALTFGEKGPKVGNAEIRKRRLATTTGDLSVLVARVSTLDRSMSKGVAEISGDVFGTAGSGDANNFKGNAEACSHNVVTINPASGTGSGCVDDPDAVFNVPRNDPGIIYNCDFFNDWQFSTPGDLCPYYGDSTQVDDPNQTANTRCCICGGGDLISYDNGVVDGVLNLQLSINTVGTDKNVLETQAVETLKSLFAINDLAEKFDMVMICLPWGSHADEDPSKTNWIAYAYVGGVVSVYNGDFNCANEDNQMHEIGHNWGLRHASGTNILNGVATFEQYGDMTGWMGYTYSVADDGIQNNKMCYNGAHSWQLGWYTPYNIEIDPLTTNFVGTLVGVDRVPNVLSGENVVLKLSNSAQGLYILYNHAVGVNVGTANDARGAPNQVTITSLNQEGLTYMEARLSQGSYATFTNWAGTSDSVTILVTSITTDATTGNANVEVWKGAIGDRPAAPVPTTPSPTSAPLPTPQPTPLPTPVPIPQPTKGDSKPTKPPKTGGGGDAPTEAPAPTPQPVSVPTASAPTPAPTKSGGGGKPGKRVRKMIRGRKLVRGV